MKSHPIFLPPENHIFIRVGNTSLKLNYDGVGLNTACFFFSQLREERIRHHEFIDAARRQVKKGWW